MSGKCIQDSQANYQGKTDKLFSLSENLITFAKMSATDAVKKEDLPQTEQAPHGHHRHFQQYYPSKKQVLLMRYGMRKPSWKKSLSARTTGRATRAVKRALIPGYGKRGMGWLHPKKALYNRAYRRTTFSIFDLARPSGCHGASNSGCCIVILFLILVIGVFSCWV